MGMFDEVKVDFGKLLVLLGVIVVLMVVFWVWGLFR